MKKSKYLSLIFAVVCLLPMASAHAQDGQSDEPVYIVQPGDSLWAIAQQFGVSIDALAEKNQMSKQSQLSIGARLIIPGLEGISGILVTDSVNYGESLESLSRRYGVSPTNLSILNRYTSPDEVYAGSSLVIPFTGDDDVTPVGGRATLKVGQSLLELAIAHGISPWTLITANHLENAWSVIPGETLYYPDSEKRGPGALPEDVVSVDVGPSPLVQGQTMVIKIEAVPGATLTGSFNGLPLNFFQDNNGKYIALQGIHAMLDPGYYDLAIFGILTEDMPIVFSQKVYIREGAYPYDPPLVVNSETIDNETNAFENHAWFDAVAPLTAEKSWDGVFLSPVPAIFSDCFPSLFGNRRSYNDGGYYFFHTGLDFCGHVGVEIYAPAAGKIVFAESTVVRGNATIIDHGWGVFSAYAHQEQMFVAIGDQVKAGQLIGYVGATGRVTGPHLHWEILVGGVQVNPQQWMQMVYP